MKLPFGSSLIFKGEKTLTFRESATLDILHPAEKNPGIPFFFQAEHRQLILDFRLEAQCFSDLQKNPQKFSREEHMLRFFLVKRVKKS